MTDMLIYIFGNPDFEPDSIAIKAAKEISTIFEYIQFEYINPNEDLPFAYKSSVIIMDAVCGIKIIRVFNENDIEKLISSPRNSVHDFDLGFQLKYLKKLGKLKRVSIIGLPIDKEVDYDSLHSILRKLVAQDMQGS